MTKLANTTADPLGPGLDLVDGQLVLSAANSDTPGGYNLTAIGRGCSEVECGLRFSLTIAAAVTPLETVPYGAQAFTMPAPDRLQGLLVQPTGVATLPDEFLLTLGSPQFPGTLDQAVAVAQATGSVVTGALEDLGVYELRFTSPPSDLEATMAEARQMPNVTAAGPSVFADMLETRVPPGDWNDDGAAVTWAFDQIRAQQAWDITTGETTHVGIVDGGTVWRGHEDLNVEQTIGSSGVGNHGTHVAGTSCAKANGKGLVGVAWGCPVTTVGLSPLGQENYSQAVKDALQGARQIAYANVSVVNMSLGYNWSGQNRCVTQAQSDAINQMTQRDGAASQFRQLFNGPLGRNIVWTLAAGNNCGEGVHSPWGANWALPNVVTVAASNSDGTLASFSNFGPGVEVAAPGGVGVGIPGGTGIWSTVPKGLRRRLLLQLCDEVGYVDGCSSSRRSSRPGPER